jgi:glycosyltransferase involved in cell wall biosynthesis
MRVSVVIPTYNYGCFVNEAVDSALGQTVPPHEVIVVDDGSTDDTRDRLSTYSGKIRYIRQENRGVSVARNTGIAAATGDLFALLDSDDAFHLRKLEFQTTYLRDNPSVGLLGTESFSDPASKWPSISPVATELSLESLVVRTRFAPSSAIIRRSTWERVGGFDPMVGGAADRDYWIRSALQCSVSRLNAPLTFYREHGGAMSRNTELMVAHEQAVLDKAFAMPELRSRYWLRRRTFGIAELSHAYTYLADAHCLTEAARAYLKSFRYWPFPFKQDDVSDSLHRLRFGLRLVQSVMRG